jgi:hypothetical protein
VAGLGVEGEFAALGSCTLLGNPRDVSKDQVDLDSLDDQPRSTVDPRTPAPTGGDRHVIAGPTPGDLLERREVDVDLDVQAQIDIGIRPVRSAGSTPPERDRPNTSHRAELAGEPAKAIIVKHDSDPTAADRASSTNAAPDGSPVDDKAGPGRV